VVAISDWDLEGCAFADVVEGVRVLTAAERALHQVPCGSRRSRCYYERNRFVHCMESAALVPRGAARIQAIFAATLELIAELGYERMTMDAIATRAHASKATMYRRWPD
jgi:AcrR family transcriptional regulator